MQGCDWVRGEKTEKTEWVYIGDHPRPQFATSGPGDQLEPMDSEHVVNPLINNKLVLL